MGTAIVGVAASMDPGGSPSLASAGRTFGQVMAIVAAVLAVVLALGYLGRFVWHPRAVLADLKDPAVGALYATIPAGILVLAAAAAAIGPTWFSPQVVRDLVVSFDWAGVPLAFLMSLAFAYVLFAHPGLAPSQACAPWLAGSLPSQWPPACLAWWSTAPPRCAEHHGEAGRHSGAPGSRAACSCAAVPTPGPSTRTLVAKPCPQPRPLVEPHNLVRAVTRHEAGHSRVKSAPAANR